MPRNRKKSSIEEPIVRKLGTGKNWLLASEYEVSVMGHFFSIPEGFVFDLASIPKFLHWLIDEDELGLAAPLVHDAIYRHNGELPEGWSWPILKFTKREADDLLYELAIMSGAPTWRAKLAWSAVRLFAKRDF